MRLTSNNMRLDSLLAGVNLTGGCLLPPRHLRISRGRLGIPAPRALLKSLSTVAGALENPRLSCALSFLKLAAGIDA